MADFLSIERRDTGASWRDATADEAFISERDFDNAKERHTERFDACDLAELADGELLALVKSGNGDAAGALLVSRFNARVTELATWSVA
jgi:hypothetical protein